MSAATGALYGLAIGDALGMPVNDLPLRDVAGALLELRCSSG